MANRDVRARVGHFVYNYWGYSGAATQAKKLANELVNSNIFCVFFDSPSIGSRFRFISRHDSNANATVISLPSNTIIKSLLIVFFSIKYKINIFHFHGFHRISIFVGLLLKKKLFLKTTLMGKDDFGVLSKSYLNRFLISNIDISNSLTPDIESINKKFFNGHVCVIPNGVYISDDKSLGKENIAIIVGAVVPRKKPLDGIILYKEVFSKLGYKLILAGPNRHPLPEFEPKYYDFCVAESSNEDIEFVGNLEQGDLIELYRKAKVIIFMSDREGLPNVLIEALSYDVLPIVDHKDSLMRYVVGDTLLNEMLPLVHRSSGLSNTDIVMLIDNLISKGVSKERAMHFSMSRCANLHVDKYIEVLNGTLK